MKPSLFFRIREALRTWMLRGHHHETLPIVLTQRRIYILPTREGLSFAALLLAMLVASLNYNLALGFILCFSLAGIGQVCLLRTHRNLEGLTLASAYSTNAHAGGALGFELVFADGSSRNREALDLVSPNGNHQGFSIAANGHASVKLTLPAGQRGHQWIGRLRIETRFPLGFLLAWTYIDPDLSAWVYPRPEDNPPPLPSNGRGSRGSHTQPGSDSFDSLRPYQPGDPLRTIAWRRLARGGPPASKVFLSEEGGSEHCLSWNDCANMADIEARLSRLCAWALAAERSGQDWSLALPGTLLPAKHGPTHLHTALEALAAIPNGR